MSSSKIDNTTLNRVFDYIIKYNYDPTPVDILQKKLRYAYANKLEETKRKIKELENTTPIDLL